MTRPGPLTFGRALLMSLTAALTVWISMFAWRPLSVTSEHLTPLLFCVLLLALTNAVARLRDLAGVWVTLLQTATAGLLLLWWTSGSPVPRSDSLIRLGEVFAAAFDSADRYAAPVPTDVAPVTPLFFTVGLVSMVVVSLLALSARRVALTGLVFFVLQVVPVNLGAEVSWFVFVLVAAGYLCLLFLSQANVITQWGHDVADSGSRRGFVTNASTGRVSAWQIGVFSVVGAIALSTVLSSVVPGTGTRFGPQKDSASNEVTLTSPLVDLRRDLVRGADVPLLRVEGTRKPSYVRTAVLAAFNGREWSSGSRRAARVQGADGAPLELPGVAPALGQERTRYDFEATAAFRSRWLPVMPLTDTVTAEGDWRYDLATMDFAAFDNDLDTAGLSWRVTGVELDYDVETLDGASERTGLVSDEFLEVPDDLPPMVADLADRVTGDSESNYRKARALQSWFRSEFTYSLERADSVGNDELVAFLDESGRVGYCEQFAASMAVMARTLNIPSRVAVGFLEPRSVGEDLWEFSAHDLHAWPELFFAGSGWVRFEPTPASRASGVPEHSEDDFEQSEEAPAPEESLPSSEPSEEPVAPQAQPRAEETTEADRADSGPSPWMVATALGLLLAVLLAGVAVVPGWLRRRRRHRRFQSVDVESLWTELHDTAIDLRLPWPGGRSPQVIGEQVRKWCDPDEPTAQAAVRRLVHAVEVHRFSRASGPATAALIQDLETCLASLEAAGTRGDRRRARWLPRSLAPWVR
ncbi:transglutaminaseTgpA domain-containing protein [Nocardioides gilvus]|uniref:transglutaminase family protein n=1 Tax=Nocardioides gilvus TaxID=1735589 RepID=UPI000D745F42|nr:DUF3488 and transglutaminase-like domain-containing protein [Nocardioides gilvus]